MAKFGDAFAAARKAGKKEFTFDGKRYNTRTREDEAKSAGDKMMAPVKAAAAKAAPKPLPKSESKPAAVPKPAAKPAAPASKPATKMDPRDMKRNIPREIMSGVGKAVKDNLARDASRLKAVGDTAKANMKRDADAVRNLPKTASSAASAARAGLKEFGGKYGTKAMRDAAKKKGMACGGSYKRGKK
jgi:hypothetical protein